MIRASEGDSKSNRPGKPENGGRGEKADGDQLMEEFGHVEGRKANIDKNG